MRIHATADQVRYSKMTTAQLREAFLLENLCKTGELNFVYVDIDRAIVGMAAPLEKPILLTGNPELRSEYFTERREIGILNIGSTGRISVNGKTYSLENLDCLYVGRGSRDIRFESVDQASPSVFYLLSYPAHSQYPTTLIRKQDSQPAELGSAEQCNARTVCKYIHLNGARSCQLVMGVTHLRVGSAWNTMPAHTHWRRSEIYMYFNLNDDARIFHFMGSPEETRQLIMKNREAVVSPGWSIHCGVGTQTYSFCWGMGGENQDYADMDPAPLASLR